MTIIKEKWIDLSVTTFTESKEETKDHKIDALIVPFNKISRNGVLYKKESIEAKHENLVGKPIFFNHQTSGAGDEFLPRGEWNETWLESDGMHAKGNIFKTGYNKGLIEYLSHAKKPKVSLQINGEAESKKDENGKYYQAADINEFLESSVVSLPGFIDASATFAAMCESMNNKLNKEKVKEKEFYKKTSKLGQKILDTLNKGKSIKEVTWWLDYLYNTGIINKTDYNDAYEAVDLYNKGDKKGYSEAVKDFKVGDIVNVDDPETGEPWGAARIHKVQGKYIWVNNNKIDTTKFDVYYESLNKALKSTEAVKDFKVGDKVGTKAGNGTITDIKGNMVYVDLDSKDTNIGISIMDVWKHVKEDFFNELDGIRINK